jgi:hypothetical protein
VNTAIYCLEQRTTIVDGVEQQYWVAVDGSLPVHCQEAAHIMHVGFAMWNGEPDYESAVVECSCNHPAHPDHHMRSGRGDCLPAMILYRRIEQESGDWNFLPVVDQILIEMFRERSLFLSVEPDNSIPEYLVRSGE